MPSPDSTVKVLLIRPWIHSLTPLRAAMRSAGYEARFTRVDIEAALHAALARGGFDLAIVDPATPGLSRSTIEGCLRDHRSSIPMIELGGSADLVDQIRRALDARRS